MKKNPWERSFVLGRKAVQIAIIKNLSWIAYNVILGSRSERYSPFEENSLTHCTWGWGMPVLTVINLSLGNLLP